ncbi:hypothetical protein F4778DRAFT_635032 [Xylariomycetidae sp. FL2044]|nr:hypothetical protein F4778DRAFT_635032 [Xylariomycetidae sp. FL2044]
MTRSIPAMPALPVAAHRAAMISKASPSLTPPTRPKAITIHTETEAPTELPSPSESLACCLGAAAVFVSFLQITPAALEAVDNVYFGFFLRTLLVEVLGAATVFGLVHLLELGRGRVQGEAMLQAAVVGFCVSFTYALASALSAWRHSQHPSGGGGSSGGSGGGDGGGGVTLAVTRCLLGVWVACAIEFFTLGLSRGVWEDHHHHHHRHATPAADRGPGDGKKI